MKNFAKIIEYKDFQIVLQKVWEYDDELEQSIPGVKQTTTTESDYEINVLLGFHEKLERDNFFDQYNDTDAQNFIDEVCDSVEKNEIKIANEELHTKSNTDNE